MAPAMGHRQWTRSSAGRPVPSTAHGRSAGLRRPPAGAGLRAGGRLAAGPTSTRSCGPASMPHAQANGALRARQAARPQPARGRQRRGRRGRPGRRGHARGRRSRLHQRHLRRLVPERADRRDRRRSAPRRASAATSRDRRHRLLGTQRRQGDARRSPAHDGHRRCARAHARVPGSPRHPREPHRRLGHPVRHAHRAHGRRGPDRRRRPAARSATSTRSTSRRGSSSTRATSSRSAPATACVKLQSRDDARDHAAVAGAGRRVDAPLQRAVRQARHPADRRRPGRRVVLPTVHAGGPRTARRMPGCWTSPTAPRWCGCPATPTAKARRCR